MADNDNLITKDVAEILGVSPNTLRLWRTKDRGPKYFMKGYGRYLYKRDDVEAFAKEFGYDRD